MDGALAEHRWRRELPPGGTEAPATAQHPTAVANNHPSPPPYSPTGDRVRSVRPSSMPAPARETQDAAIADGTVLKVTVEAKGEKKSPPLGDCLLPSSKSHRREPGEAAPRPFYPRYPQHRPDRASRSDPSRPVSRAPRDRSRENNHRLAGRASAAYIKAVRAASTGHCSSPPSDGAGRSRAGTTRPPSRRCVTDHDRRWPSLTGRSLLALVSDARARTECVTSCTPTVHWRPEREASHRDKRAPAVSGDTCKRSHRRARGRGAGGGAVPRAPCRGLVETKARI